MNYYYVNNKLQKVVEYVEFYQKNILKFLYKMNKNLYIHLIINFCDIFE